jgi:hypothetical protein
MLYGARHINYQHLLGSHIHRPIAVWVGKSIKRLYKLECKLSWHAIQFFLNFLKCSGFRC